jgi:hypothetical protein
VSFDRVERLLELRRLGNGGDVYARENALDRVKP